MPILDDYSDFKTFGASLGKCRRTIERWTEQPDGLPYLKVGSLKLIHIPSAQRWLLGRVQQRNPQRRHNRTQQRKPEAKRA